jgi:hypothetical protein
MAPRAAQAGPTAMDALDPAPVHPAPVHPAPARRRPPPRRRGANETAVRRDLEALPPDLRKGAIAAVALGLARDLDEGGMTARDKAGMYAQLRMAMVTLREIAPGEAKGDHTDEVRERREKRLNRQA